MMDSAFAAVRSTHRVACTWYNSRPSISTILCMGTVIACFWLSTRQVLCLVAQECWMLFGGVHKVEDSCKKFVHDSCILRQGLVSSLVPIAANSDRPTNQTMTRDDLGQSRLGSTSFPMYL